MKLRPGGVVFFDAGGTLIHPVRPVGVIYAEEALDFGVTADAEKLQAGFLRTWKAMKPRDPVDGARVTDDQNWWREVVRESWRGQDLPKDFESYFEKVYHAFAQADRWQAYPEVEQVLQSVKEKGLRCAVLSNWDRRLRSILAGFSWSIHFEDLIISSEMGVEKPHPRIFQEAEKRLGVTSEQAVLWGDEARYDVEGALAAGWQVGLLDRPKNDLSDLLAELTVSNAI